MESSNGSDFALSLSLSLFYVFGLNRKPVNPLHPIPPSSKRKRTPRNPAYIIRKVESSLEDCHGKEKDVPEKIPRSGNRTVADKPEGGSGKRGTQRPVPIVGLGASAGGLEALKTFFAAAARDRAAWPGATSTPAWWTRFSRPKRCPKNCLTIFHIRPPARISNPVRPMITRNVSKRIGPLKGGVEA